MKQVAKLGQLAGFNPLVPKIHELLHINYDLRMFGPASEGTSAGTFLVRAGSVSLCKVLWICVRRSV
jgi:hypothetical protein